MIPLDRESVQCALTHDIQLSVSFSIERLESDIKEAVVFSLAEKQSKLLELFRLSVVFCKILNTTLVHSALIRILDMVIENYDSCKQDISKMVSTDVTNFSRHNVIRDEEVRNIESKYKKLLLLLTILKESKENRDIKRILELTESTSLSSSLNQVDFDSASSIQLEYLRMIFFYKMDIIERVHNDVEYSMLLEELKHLKSLSLLNSIFHGKLVIYCYIPL
jgi:hypothetical protein